MDFTGIINRSRDKVKELLNLDRQQGLTEEVLSKKDDYNLLYKCDNTVAILDLLSRGYEGKVDLVYVDPPFFTNLNFYSKTDIDIDEDNYSIEYLDYEDVWNNDLEDFLETLTLSLILIKRLLSDKGSIYVHLDFRTIHYVKIIMDMVFGKENFLNEIIWSYKSGGSSKRHFSRKHDTILLYSKTKDYIFNPSKEKSYNRGFKPYRFKNIKEYQDDQGWYTLVNLKDVWEINMVGRTSKERLDYRTQKPEALIERIILSSSKEGSIVADFFAGSGTTLSVANKNNRKWIGCDKSSTAIYTIMNRINRDDYKLIYEAKGSSKLKSTESVKKVKDRLELEVKLESYSLDTSPVRKKDREAVKQTLKNNSISLIDYIAIGYIDSIDIITKEEKNLKDRYKEKDIIKFGIENTTFPIYIKYIDIFGNIFKKIISK